MVGIQGLMSACCSPPRNTSGSTVLLMPLLPTKSKCTYWQCLFPSFNQARSRWRATTPMIHLAGPCKSQLGSRFRESQKNWIWGMHWTEVVFCWSLLEIKKKLHCCCATSLHKTHLRSIFPHLSFNHNQPRRPNDHWQALWERSQQKRSNWTLSKTQTFWSMKKSTKKGETNPKGTATPVVYCACLSGTKEASGSWG